MRAADRWTDYELVDASAGERLERWGDYVLIRPDPQVIWQTERTHPLWRQAHARYVRSASGGGQWEALKPLPEHWQVRYGDCVFAVKTMGFKHTGVFPEQAVNWDWMRSRLAELPGARVLNLFGYTGAASLMCAAAGARVTHVDASKGMVAWGRENAALSGLADKPIRWLVDDCAKFVARELRRGSRYDAILMDPPSYGRGPGGEVWKLEEAVYPLLAQCAALLSDTPLFLTVNAYTAGLSPSVMKVALERLLGGGVQVKADEVGLPMSVGGILPCGSTARATWTGE